MPRRRHDNFESSSFLEILTRPFRAIWRWGVGLASNDEIRDDRSNPVVTSLLFPLRLIFACVAFLINSWALTRTIRPFLFGIPALAVATGFFGAVWLDYFRYPNRVNKTQVYFERSMTDQRRGPELAQHFALKQVSLQPDNDDAKYKLAVVWEQIGQQSKAEDLMAYLCDREYVLAHVWFARKYLLPRPDISEDQRHEKIESYLKEAIRIAPASGQAKIALADHYLVQSQNVDAGTQEYRDLLVKANEQFMSIQNSDSGGELIWQLPKYMKVLFELSDLASADEPIGQRNYLKLAEDTFNSSKKLLSDYIRRFPSDERIPDVWNVLIGAAIQLKKYQDADELIREAKRQSNPQLAPMFDELAARLFVQQSLDFKNLEDGRQFDRALEFLSRGIVEFPLNATVSERLVQLILPNRDDGKNYVSQVEKTTSIDSVVHLMKGIHKVSLGDVLAGQTHWRIAQRQNQSSQIILFSLIRSLVTKYRDYPNIGDVIALAIEEFPNQGLFYFLRGSHHLLNKDYELAVSDLKQAIEMTNEAASFEIHVQLTKCYIALDDQKNADAQRRTLQKMINRAPLGRRSILEEYVKELD